MATGLEKMLQQILDEANETAKKKVAEAKAEADSIMAEANKAAAVLDAENQNKMAAVAVSSREKANSSAQLKRRQVLLKTKQEIINDILRQAQQAFTSMETEEYFSYIEKMLKKYTQAKNGEICFNTKDLQRMPANFSSIIEKIARENGGKLIISENSVNILGGFVLVYGGIEENCSIEAMFHTQREMLADKLNRFLF
ncbi:MAG: V-type ATP synthase subunit E [Lachnospiraceae bacterium]